MASSTQQTKPQEPNKDASKIANKDAPKGANGAAEPNEGEGSRSAARHYNEQTEKYAHSGRVEEAATAAEKALEGPEGDELREAEARAKSTKPATPSAKH